MKPFQIIQHTADLQLQVTGTCFADLFINAMHGMVAYLHPTQLHTHRVQRPITVRSYDRESLLIDFLSEVLYLSLVHHEAYDTLQIQSLDAQAITAVLQGAPSRAFTHDIKAVTHHDVHITQRDGVWSVNIVFDI